MAKSHKLFVQFGLDAGNGSFNAVGGHYVVLGRIDEDLRLARQSFRRDGVYIADLLDLIAEELKAYPERFVRGP